MKRTNRREFLKSAGAATGVAGLAASSLARAQGLVEPRWDAGELSHILPTCSHNEMLLKCSFISPQRDVPMLRIDDREVPGVNTDSDGEFWQFHVRDLRADVLYELELVSSAGRPLASPWTLRTFPAPDATPSHLRLLAYTCAGGPLDGGQYLTAAVRNRLLDRAMSFAPDAVIANGDHVYWDQRTTFENHNQQRRERAMARYAEVGMFNRNEPVLGFGNEAILKRAVGPQIAGLYGTRYRSTPVFFFADDHDYFENDEADDRFVTFPPDALSLRLQRATQHLYYPEFLHDSNRPLGLPGSAEADRSTGLSECYGTLRYGNLLEVLMYDCGRHVSLKGKHAGLIAPEAEEWLLSRISASDTRHLINIPSTPFCWSAGKWREWYADLLETDSSVRAPGTEQMTSDGGGRVPPEENPRLGTTKRKHMWQEGWFLQHQRLMAALTAQDRPAVLMSGDLHACGWDRMLASGDIDMRGNAPWMFLHGTLGTGENGGWPSSARGIGPSAATAVTVERGVDPIEKNGFSIIDITPELMTVRMFAWRAPDPVEAIDNLEPYDVVEIPRKV